MRRTRYLDRDEAFVDADTMLHVHDKIARREGCSLSNEISCFPTLARPADPFSQNILLRKNTQAFQLKASIQRQFGDCEPCRPGAINAISPLNGF